MQDKQLTKQMLKTETGEFCLESIHTLNLCSCGKTYKTC